MLLLPTAVFAAASGPPYVIAVDPPPGTVSSFRQLTFTFNEPITEVANNDLTVNNAGAHNVPFVSGNVLTFTFPAPPYGPVEIRLGGIKDFDATPSTMTQSNWTYVHVDTDAPVVTNLFPAAGATVRRLGQMEVCFSEPVKGIEAGDLLVNGTPATNLLVRPNGLLVFQFAEAPSGLAQMSWAANHGISDCYWVSNRFAAPGPWFYLVQPARTYADVVISEICAANRTGLADEDGLASDWIEIHNRDTNIVDLAGWSLSDDLAAPGKWVFPARVLAPGARLVVFASAKDRRTPMGTNALHLNFTLSAGGEFLGLFAPDSPPALRHGFEPAYPAQRNDLSWGEDTDGRWGYFTVPTPGLPNNSTAFTNLCEPVHCSVERGFFTQPFDLVLTTPTPGATIRYTTNGVEPTATTGFTYAAPLRMTTTTILRAAAYRAGHAPSTVRTHTYLFNQSAAVRSLPVLSIVTPANTFTGRTGINGLSVSNFVAQVWTPLTTNDWNNHLEHGLAWERPVSAELIRPGDNGGFQTDCGIRVQGSGFMRWRYAGPLAGSSKFSYRLYFRGDYGEEKLRYRLFPLSSVSDFDVIVLRAGHNDQTNPFLKDELARRLHRDMGQAAATGTYVNLFVNGVYKGYYNPCERLIDDSFDLWEGADELGWDHITLVSRVQSGDRAAWDDLMQPFLTGQDFTQPAIYQTVAERLDLENFVDYLLACFASGIGDWPQNNWHAARPRSPGGKFQFYGWDFESGFGSNPAVDMFTADLEGPTEIARFYRGLVTSTEFRLLFADRVQKHFFNGGALMDSNVVQRFNEMKSELAGVIPAMNTGILSTWVPGRRPALFSQFAARGLYASNAPAFNQHGGRISRGFVVTLSTPQGGTIYYTLDGADPRVPFSGAVATNALVYSGGLPLNVSRLIRARVLSGTNWSPLVEAQFQVASLGVPLRITEINYNPVGGNIYEFLELYNAGPVALDLGGMYFDAGISYTFPLGAALGPGATLVLANNGDPAAFAARYPGVVVAGWFAGNLSNAGERIALKDAAGNPVLSVDYSDGGGWPPAADGGGATLEIIDALGEPDDPANWRASTSELGSPGSLSLPAALPLVRINELCATGALPEGDWVELHNAGAGDADMGNWSLTDNGDARAFVFPTDTILPAGGYLLVWCGTNGAAPGLRAPFALDAEGDNLYLFDAQTQRVDAVSFGSQVPGFALGRMDGAWSLTLPTTNAANLAVPLGSATNITINEWLANPAPGLPDWLELHNRGALPVALRGCYLATSNAVHLLAVPAFIAPAGFVRVFADEQAGPNHLDFRLPAAGGMIAFFDPLAMEVDRVGYGAQAEGVSSGRLPDGGASLTNFPGTASPGAANYVTAWSGPVFSEVVARGVAATNAEFIELHNPGTTGFDLGGYSVSVDRSRAGRWIFPPGTVMAPGSWLVLWAATNRPVSTDPADFNLGEALDGDSGGAFLFNPAGQLVEQIEYGPQMAGLGIGLSGGQWRLLAAPTPGATNAPPQVLGANAALRLNEWLAATTNGPDWFELHNATNLPVELSGLYLTDDPSTVGLTKFQIPPLSYIAAGGWTRFVADNDPEQGWHHVNFNLDGEGEGLWLLRTNAGGAVAVIDSVSFGRQAGELSQGRWPDGASLVADFAGSASPGAANYLVTPPLLLVAPTNLVLRTGSNAVFTIAAAGALPLAYQWYFNGDPLPGATNNAYARANIQFADQGAYSVVVSNALGSATASASLTIAVPPTILQQPVPVTVATGERVTLSILADGYPPPFTYEWRLYSMPVTTNVSDRTMDFYTFLAPSYPTQLFFRVVVKNPANPSGVIGSFAAVIVVADFDADGLPDSWEAAHGFPTNSSANRLLDSDGDGLSNFAEYLAGTSPTNAASCLRLDAAPPLNASNAVFSFTAQPGKTYSVRWSPAPGPAADWQRWLDFPAAPVPQAQMITDPFLHNGGTNRYFQLVTPRQP